MHKDVKLENLLLAHDGLIRLADFGNLGETGDTITAHDPTYFPPDWAALLPDGRHVFEDPVALAAANTGLLDLRGLGMALIKGYAGGWRGGWLCGCVEHMNLPHHPSVLLCCPPPPPPPRPPPPLLG